MHLEDLLGKKATDKVTGFTGTITAAAMYLHGSDSVQVTTTIYEGQFHEDWFPVERLCIE